MRAALLLPVGLLACAWMGACGGDEPGTRPGAAGKAKGSESLPERIGPYPRAEFVIAHDAFLAGDDPKTVPAAEAGFLRDTDEVYGIVVAQRARAYAVGMLSYHHVINDVMAGTPVAVTY